MANPTFDYVHTGPGTLAGRYLRAFWQPISRSEDLERGRARTIRIMSEKFTLYRGQGGAPHLVDFRCAHRGTQLSVGWVEDDCIRCRYHGWKFDGTGQCVEQPDQVPSFAHKIRIRGFPTHEYLGLIFAYLGEGEPPPFRTFKEFEDHGVLKVGVAEVWPCNFFNRCENTVDTIHVNWTHRATRDRLNLGHRVLHRVPTSVDETDYGIKHVMTMDDGRTERLDFYMPNVSYVRPNGRVEGSTADAGRTGVHRLFFYVPIDDENCSTFVVDSIPMTEEAAQQYAGRVEQDRRHMTMGGNDMGAAVLNDEMRIEDIGPDVSSYYSFWVEDYVTLVGQGAIPDRDAEHLANSDMGPILMRKLWQRELKAFDAGAPIKRWDPRLVAV